MCDFMETGRGHVKCEDLKGAVSHEMVDGDIRVYVGIGLAKVGGMDPHAGVEFYGAFLYNLMIFSVHLVICRPYNT